MQTLLQLARSPIKLSRDEFCATFGGGGFDLRALDDDDWAKLAELGVSRRRLQSLAGADAQIDAPDFDALFAWLDALDRDGSGRTIDVALSGRKGTMLTRCGVALETLRKTFVPRDVLGVPRRSTTPRATIPTASRWASSRAYRTRQRVVSTR